MYSNTNFNTVGKVAVPFGTSQDALQENVFLFDANVLLDTNHGEMDHAFASYLADFAEQRSCYILSNMNYAETVSRIPSRLRRRFAGIFASAGTEFWRGSELLVRHEHDFCDDLYEYVARMVLHSAYPQKQAPLIDSGSATLRICLAGTRVGRTAKKAYLAWENEHRELDAIISSFERRFSDFDICKDTEVSLLITPKSFSTAEVQNQMLRRHKAARVIAYLGKTAASGYAKPMCDALLSRNVLSTVAGPSDISQLLSYERRLLKDIKPKAVAPTRLFQGAWQ
nr:hypothetical protein [uncultured Roseibium sp.]